MKTYKQILKESKTLLSEDGFLNSLESLFDLKKAKQNVKAGVSLTKEMIQAVKKHDPEDKATIKDYENDIYDLEEIFLALDNEEVTEAIKMFDKLSGDIADRVIDPVQYKRSFRKDFF
jgi:hypothetical protein